MPRGVVETRYIFDIYAILEIINGTNNRAKALLFDGLHDGSIKVLKNLGDELKAIDEGAYRSFQDGRPGRCYIQIENRHHDYSSALIEDFGGSVFRSNPTVANFLIVAISAQEHVTLVAHGKGHTQCRRIIDNCRLAPHPRLQNVAQFLAEIDDEL